MPNSSGVPFGAYLGAYLLVTELLGCGASLPGPSLTRHPNESYVEVPYPPTASLAETVPPRPRIHGTVWIDGDWIFRGKFYAWQRGGWLVPPTGARYAASQVVYLNGGRVLFAPGTWYDVTGQAMVRPQLLVPAYTPPNEVTSEFQTGR